MRMAGRHEEEKTVDTNHARTKTTTTKRNPLLDGCPRKVVLNVKNVPKTEKGELFDFVYERKMKISLRKELMKIILPFKEIMICFKIVVRY